ncbi:hypothetical protein M595_5056 [Lyngbya aestuarii BL J]|uniref:Uncharacterized protein n=1 Tax=Lyngbya aestuarii BL J TaxID=1348334 RepID=U7QF06_9CYAN|nr:hypothetical protein M595_5056 [Lyngbya aestuarii BL J]
MQSKETQKYNKDSSNFRSTVSKDLLSEITNPKQNLKN